MEGFFLKIRKDLRNENNLIRKRKSPFLLSQKESLDEQVNKYPCLLDKNNKMKNIQTTRPLKKNAWETEEYYIVFIISILLRKILKVSEIRF